MAIRLRRLFPAPDGGDGAAQPSAWRVGVPVVCLLAGLLLGATHGVSGGGEIRRSDAPRLVDLVRSETVRGRPVDQRTGPAGQHHRLDARPVPGCGTGGDEATVRRARR